MSDVDAEKVTAKREANKLSCADKNKVDKKIESEKPCTAAIDTLPSVSFKNMDNLKSGKYGGMGEGGVLVTQESMVDADAYKVDANAK